MTTREADVVAKANFRELFRELKRTKRLVGDLEDDLDDLGEASASIEKLGGAVEELGHAATRASALPRAVEAADRAAREATTQTRKQAAAVRSVAQAHAQGRQELQGSIAQQREATETLGRGQAHVEQLVAQEVAMRQELLGLEGELDTRRAAGRSDALAGARHLQAIMATTLEDEARQRAEIAGRQKRDQREVLEGIQHQRRLAEALGKEESKIEDLLRREAALRHEIALADGNAAQARREARTEELRRAQRTGAAQRAQAQAEIQAVAQLAAERDQLHREQLEALQHQLRMAEVLERSQAEIDELVAREFAMRRQMAMLENDVAASRRVAREQELAGARKLREQTVRRAAAEKAAAERRRALDAEEASAKQRAFEAQENQLRRQMQIRELSGTAALRIEQQILGLQLRQAKAGIAATADERFRKQQRILDIQAQQVVMARKIAAANRGILPAADLDRMRAGWEGVSGQMMGVATALAAVGAAAAAIDHLMVASVKLDAIYNNLPFGIDAARNATRGLVSDTELAQAAIEAQRLGVVQSEEEFAKLSEAAMKLGLSVGRDAADSVRDLTAALGKGETELLDNLGIKMRVSEAEKAYAQRLGVSKKMLTDAQKAEAFRTMGMLKVLEAAEGVNVEVDDGVAKWAEWKAEANALARDVLPRIITVLEALIDYLEFYADMWGQVLGTVDDAIDQVYLWSDALRYGDDATRTMTRGVSALNGEYENSIYNVAAFIEEQERLQAQRAADKTAEEELQQQIAARDEMLAKDKQLLWEMQKQSKLMDAQGGYQDRVNQLVEYQVELEADILRAQGEELKAEKLLLDHEVAKIKDRKKRAKEWAQAYDQRLTREREARLAEVDSRRSLVEAEGELRTRALDRHRLELDMVRAARQELDVREAIAQRMRTGNADQRHEQEQELLEITTERRLLDVEVMKLEQDRAQELAEWRLASIEREIERHEALGLAVDDLRERRREAAVDLAHRFGSEDDLAAALHEADLERRSEKQAVLEAEHQEQLRRRDEEIEQLDAQGIAVEEHQVARLNLEAKLAHAEGRHEAARVARHKAEVARLKNLAAVRKQVHGAVNNLMTGSAAVAEFAAEQAIKSDERREAVFKKIQGSMAIARAAVELVEGVAAAARYDFVSAAQHFLASGLGFAKGAVLLSGGLPGPGREGGGAANSSTYAAPGASAGVGTSTSTNSSNDHEVPLSGSGVTGEDLDQARKSVVGSSEESAGGSTTININGPVIGHNSDKLLAEIHNARSA